MYVVVGLHRILAEHLDEYLLNVRRHSQNSAAEPGCLRYEVLQDQDDPLTICLFEVFQDEAAFADHLASAHYRWWMELSRDWRDAGARVRHVMDYVSPATDEPRS